MTGPSPQPSLVMIVEDDAALRISMARALGVLSNVEVTEAGNISEARALLRQQAPQVLLSDLRLPDGTGVELLSDIDRRGLRIPVVFISSYVNEFRHAIPNRLDIDVREKPVPIAELRSLVMDRIAAGASVAEAGPFSFQDYLQLALMGNHSILLSIEMDGHQIGRIITHAGQLWSARDARGSGDAAVQRLFLLGTRQDHIKVRCSPFHGDAQGRDVESSAAALMLEAARLLDEGKAEALLPDLAGDLRIGPGLAPELTAVEPPPNSESYDVLLDRAVGALLRKDYAAATTDFVRAHRLRPSDTMVLANLRRLRDLGYGDGGPG